MSGRSRRRRLAVLCAAAGVGLVVAASDIIVFTVGHAAQDDQQSVNYSIYNGQVAAAADREQVGTEVDVGFSGGAVNNFYPLARVDVAVAGTSAAASPADTGPFAQAVFAGQNITQPQYVFARYPGDPAPTAYRAGSANAAASATQASALAQATYAAVGNTSTSPVGAPADGSDLGTATANSYFDPALGFVTVGDSRVHHASYGGGMLVLDDVHVTVKVTTRGDGTFTKDISVTVGSASVTVNGMTVAVVIDQNGVTVAQQNAPLDTVQAVSDTLNAALAQAGITVHAVAPLVTKDGDNLHIEAEGVVVNVQQTGTPQGVPRQYVRHTLGEVVMDNEAVSAPQLPEVPVVTPPPDVFTEVPPASNTTTTITNTNTVAAPAQPAAPAPAAPPQPASRPTVASLSGLMTEPKPKWLLLAYLAWQMLMIALVGTLYLYRASLRRAR
jgi:hypothetical protein